MVFLSFSFFFQGDRLKRALKRGAALAGDLEAPPFKMQRPGAPVTFDELAFAQDSLIREGIPKSFKAKIKLKVTELRRAQEAEGNEGGLGGDDNGRENEKKGDKNDNKEDTNDRNKKDKNDKKKEDKNDKKNDKKKKKSEKDDKDDKKGEENDEDEDEEEQEVGGEEDTIAILLSKIKQLQNKLSTANSDIGELKAAVNELQQGASMQLSLPPWVQWSSSSALAQQTMMCHLYNSLAPPIDINDNHDSYTALTADRGTLLNQILTMPNTESYGTEVHQICIKEARPVLKGEVSKKVVIDSPTTTVAPWSSFASLGGPRRTLLGPLKPRGSPNGCSIKSRGSNRPRVI